MNRAKRRAAWASERLDSAPGAIPSSGYQTMDHGEAAMLSALGGAPPIGQHAYPIDAWFHLQGKRSAEKPTVEGKPVVPQVQTYQTEETALGPRSFTMRRRLRRASRPPSPWSRMARGRSRATRTTPDIPHDVLCCLSKGADRAPLGVRRRMLPAGGCRQGQRRRALRSGAASRRKTK